MAEDDLKAPEPSHIRVHAQAEGQPDRKIHLPYELIEMLDSFFGRRRGDERERGSGCGGDSVPGASGQD